MASDNYRFFSFYLTKYISREVVLGFIGGTTIFLLIMLTFQVIRLSDFVVVHQVGLMDVARLASSLLLSFLPIAVPVAFLFSVLMGVSRANSEGEILALQVTGISLFQLFAPIAIFSVMVSLFSLYSSLYTVPQGNRRFEVLITKLAHERVMATLKPGVFMEGFFGLVLFAEEITPVRNELKRVFIYDEREPDSPLAITAKAGLLREMDKDGGVMLRLADGAIHLDPKQLGDFQQKVNFKLYDINLHEGEAVDRWRAYSPPSYNYDQLQQRIKESVNDPPTHRQLIVELQRRISMAFSCFVFAALGFSIGISSKRGVRSTAIIICLGVGVVYWLSYLGATALAAGGKVAPAIAVWLPNFIFLGLAWLFYRQYGRT